MADASGPSDGPREPDADEPEDRETLRAKVEEKYDFEHFSPSDMAEMTAEEWEAAFDPDSWITGPALLERVEADLRARVARREVFAVVERTAIDGEACVLAYSDVDYAVVRPDGSVEGEGSILEDVEPVVALCSMADYDVPEPPAEAGLPRPEEVTDRTGSLGDRLLLTLAGVQIVAGVFLLASPLLLSGNGGGSTLLTTVVGLAFLLIGVVLGVLVANARLSGRFRAAEYRDRLRAAGVGSDERPSFLPEGLAPAGGEAASAGRSSGAGRGEGDAGPNGGGGEPDAAGAGPTDAGARTGASQVVEGAGGDPDDAADEPAEPSPD